MRGESRCFPGVLGSAVAGIAAAGAFGGGLLDQLDTFKDASEAFETLWVAGSCLIGMTGGIAFGVASFCLKGPK
jgi:hypothetical protein